MAVYTVHLPQTASATAAMSRARFVREGFSWGAFVFGPLWLIFRGLWLALVLWIIAAALVAGAVVVFSLSPTGTVAIAVLVAFFFGLEGNGLRREALRRRHFRFADVTVARNRDEAERHFFARWLAVATDEAAGCAARAVRCRPPPTGDAIVGLFPEAGGLG